jgi:hypothetical protein
MDCLENESQEKSLMLEKLFQTLCQLRLFHDYQQNEKGEERCTFCNKERNYDNVGGFLP